MHTFKSLWCRLAVAAALMMAARPAWADRKAEARAKAFYLDGQKAYDIGEFQRAIDNFKKAYEISPKPGLVFNIAQAYRLLGDAKQSVFFYKTYLRQLPDAANRADVEGWIAQLEAQIPPIQDPIRPPVDPPPTDPRNTVDPLTDEPLTPEDLRTNPDGSKKIPRPETIADGSDIGRELNTPPDDGARDRDRGGAPIYKKWWFWTGVGAVAVGATVLLLMTQRSDGPDYPDTHFSPTVEAFE